MSGWLRLIWFAVAVSGALALMTHDGVYGIAAGVVWALVIVPFAALLITRRAPAGAVDDSSPAYWRTGSWQSGAR